MNQAAPQWQKLRCQRKALRWRRQQQRLLQRRAARMTVLYNKAPSTPPARTATTTRRSSGVACTSLLLLAVLLFSFACTISPVSAAWPPPQDRVASATEIKTLSWLFVPVLGWALGHGHKFPYFASAANDTTSIFPVVLSKLNSALSTAGISFHTFFYSDPISGWYANADAQELMIGLFGNAAGGILEEYAQIVGGHVKLCQSNPGRSMSTSAWIAYEAQMRRSCNYTVMLRGLHSNTGYQHLPVPQEIVAAILHGHNYQRPSPHHQAPIPLTNQAWNLSSGKLL